MNLSEKLVSACGKPIENCTNRELYEALLTMVQQEACARTAETGKKKVYYISAEFLIGKLLSNNLINLGMMRSGRFWQQQERISVRLRKWSRSLPLETAGWAVWQPASWILWQVLD